MLATGGTLVAAIDFLLERGADDITAVCLLAAPEGLAAMEQVVGAHRVPVRRHRGLDERLNDKATSCRGSGTPATACTASPSDLGLTRRTAGRGVRPRAADGIRKPRADTPRPPASRVTLVTSASMLAVTVTCTRRAPMQED